MSSSLQLLPAHHDMRGETLSPLPLPLKDGLVVVTIFGFLSFFASAGLFSFLTYRMIKWARNGKHTNQFIILIYNLVLADLQQSIAFLLNSRWLSEDSITIGTSGCWAQGWFISTGDLASGAFCFFIGLHTFASIVFNYRLSNMAFGISILSVWAFVYLLAIIGVALHPSDIYVRAVSWCWMNSKYPDLRLWLHYFWIFTFEFGIVFIYFAIYMVVRYRLRTNYYAPDTIHAAQAKTAAKLMIVYPIIYVICTLPLATLRMVSMSNPNTPISFTWFCFAGAMITCNGWLDVLLYTMTRRILLFSDDPNSESYGVETFSMPFSGPKSDDFGTKTTCEFVGEAQKRPGSRWRQKSDLESGKSAYSSTSNLFDIISPSSRTSMSSPKSRSEPFAIAVTTITTFEVRSEPILEMDDMQEKHTFEKAGGISRSPSEKSMNIDFATKPAAFK